MMDTNKSDTPNWLVAVWPGMGSVAMTAGYYLLSKLGMSQTGEYSPIEFFDIGHVKVHRGLIRLGQRPRTRFFSWRNPSTEPDLVVLFGESQESDRRYLFARNLIEQAKSLGVQRIFTFAAMATEMHPETESRVFAAATDEESLQMLNGHDVIFLDDGHIGGMNGIMLGAAQEAGLSGICLLGEMPHIFAQFPFPKASLAVLKVFNSLAGVEMDLSELEQQSKKMEQQLGEILSHVEQAISQGETPQEDFLPEPEEPEPVLKPEDEKRIEELFEQSKVDRSKAYLLKQELDRLGLFADYEDRFLDLFKQED
ncbi:MAG: PAC2 family protein [Planctomycetaceae bacterium]|nr:PAC2 family protein [Planctomycetaceae bacterium]